MKKILHIFILFFFLIPCILNLHTIITPAYAQSSYGSSAPILPATEPGVPQDMHTFVHGLFINILSVGICYAAGFDPLTPDHKCLSFNSQTDKLGYSGNAGGGIVGMETTLIDNSFNLPIHVAPYFQFLSQNFQQSVVHKTYAAAGGSPNEIGVGAQGLDPLLKIWVGMRNIAYLFIVIVFVIIGVMIMLRIKIDPRTVMTLQNQIPKIIIGLILITFSFAIAGFLIDMTYVLTLMFLNIIAQAIGDPNGLTIANGLFTASEPIGAVDQTFTLLKLGGIMGAASQGSSVVANVTAAQIGNVPVLGGIITGLLDLIWFIPNVICAVGGWIIQHPCNANFNGVYDTLNLIIFFAILAAVIIALFRFWMSLVTAYITILFTVILSPLRILLGGLPGSPGGGFGGYMRDMLANLLIFPACISYIFLAGEMAKLISNAYNQNANGQGPAPFVLPMTTGFNFGSILALAAILMLPKIPSVVKEALKSKEVFGSAVGQALAPGVAASTNAAGQGMKSLFRKEDPLRGQRMGAGRAALFKIPGVQPMYEGISRTVTKPVD